MNALIRALVRMTLYLFIIISHYLSNYNRYDYMCVQLIIITSYNEFITNKVL